MSSDAPPLLAEPITAEDRGGFFDVIEEVVGLGSYVWQPGKRTQWSRGMYRLLGLDPTHPVAAASFFDRVHPDDRARVVMAASAVVTRGIVDEFRYRLVRPDGTLDWVVGGGWVERAADGSVYRVVGTVMRVTEHHFAAERLAQVNVLLAETQRAAGVGSYVYHLESGVLEWSDELYRVLGVDPAAPVDGLLAHQLVHPDDAARQLDWGTRVAQGEQLPPLQVRIVRPVDGRVIYLESISRRVERSSGPCVVGVSLDVTARVALEEELRQAARAEAVGALAAGIAHDFNNYLAVLSAQLDLVRMHGGALQADDHETMAGALERCAGLVRQLLAFARKQPYRPEQLELAAQVEAVAALFERVAGAGVRLALDIAARPTVHGDAAQLDAALMNLLVNARDAMPGGGEVRVVLDEHTLDAPIATVDLGRDGALPAGRYARLAVHDTGVGIAAEHLPRVFEPYFTTKDHDRGTGLGLAAVRGSVRQHGGAVRIASALGRGTTVEVLLPVHAGAATPGVRRPTSAPLATLRLLLVEDMALVREALARLLELEGHAVVTAVDGRDALERLDSGEPFDLVISDVEMPRLDGVGLARTLAARQPPVPVLLMTGYADHAAAAAVAVTLDKPFSRDELMRGIARVLAPPGR